MQLDKTYIAIRERDMLDLFDLALHVIRHFLPQLLLTFAVGVLPMLLIHHWLIGGFELVSLDQDEFVYEMGWRTGVVFGSLAIVIVLSPLAAAPTTLFLGQATFLDRPDPKRIAREWLKSLPQLLLLQMLVRALLLLFVVTVFIPYSIWPYLSEIILLERNPLVARSDDRMSTMRRSRFLHGSSTGELFGRWLFSAAVAGGMAILIFGALLLTKLWTTGNMQISRLTFVLWIEASLWITACYFMVVRFLSYLDLRIRREGWEIELSMLAEEARLAKQLS